MAKRRPLPSPPPAPVESSDDEAFSSAEEEDEKNITPIKPNPNPRKDEDEDEDEDEEETQEPVEPEEEEEEELEEEEESDDEDLPPAAAAADDEKIPDPVSESGSEPDSDSDSDEPPKAVKPISSKPMPPNPVAASPLSPRKPRDDGGAPFQRVWSLTDEIALLRGVLNYKANTGTIPHNISQKLGRFADFPDLVRGSLKMDASEGQLSEKIRRLKTKYEKATARSSPHFASAHDREAFELSAQIWGNSGASEENVVMENGGEGDPAGYRFLREAVAARKDFGAAAALEALERIDSGKARALEEKFKKQKMASLKLHVQRMDLQKETFKAIMDGVDRSG